MKNSELALKTSIPISAYSFAASKFIFSSSSPIYFTTCISSWHSDISNFLPDISYTSISISFPITAPILFEKFNFISVFSSISVSFLFWTLKIINSSSSGIWWCLFIFNPLSGNSIAEIPLLSCDSTFMSSVEITLAMK